MSYTLVILLAFGYDFQKNPVAVSTHSVSGFTTEQACKNAANKIQENNVTGWDSTNRQIKLTCVANSI
jgi:hypothetical protein